MARLFVSKLADFPVGTSKLVQGPDRPIGIFRTAERFFALEDLCPHRAGPLSEGAFDATAVTCPWHGARIALETGEPLCGPVHRAVKTFPVVIDNDDVYVEA